MLRDYKKGKSGLQESAQENIVEKMEIFDITQITLRNKLLSQIRGSVVVLRDQIHNELGNLINLIRLVKLD